MIIGGLGGLNKANKYDNVYDRHKSLVTRPDQYTLSCALILHLDEGLQLFGELFDPEETSLFQHAYRGDWLSEHCVRLALLYTHLKLFYLTQRVDPFVDDQLTVSQIIQNGFKVIWTPVDQISSLRVLLVPPDICVK